MIVVVGAGGQVGHAVVSGKPPGVEVRSFSHADLDVTDGPILQRTLEPLAPQWIVNCAAFTAVDLAETQGAQATALNDRAPGLLAKIARRCNARLLHLSTDFVFSGESNQAYLPDSTAGPLNVYGATKLAGERHVLACDDGIVLRTAWVYSARPRNFVLTMLQLMRERDHLQVVCDQIGTPTWAAGLAGAIWKFLTGSVAGGIYHWSDDGVASWYDFAVAIREEALARKLLRSGVPIVSIRSAQYPTVARRPTFSVLNCDSTREVLAMRPVHWRENLRSMLDALQAE